MARDFSLAWRSVAVMLALLSPAAMAVADPIVPGRDVYRVMNTQSVELFPGTPFNPSPDSLIVVVEAEGLLTVDRSLQSGSTIETQVAFARLTGVFPSPLPPIPFEILAGTPDLNPTRGAITNVVQDPNDPGFPSGNPSSFVSGDFRDEAYFKQVLPDGTTIYSDPSDPAVFTTLLTGLPYPPGTVFVSPGRIDLYLQTGPTIDPTSDPVIGQSFDRILIVTAVVPEPSTGTLALIGAVGLGLLARRRRPRSSSSLSGS